MFIASKQEGDKCEQSHQHYTNPCPWVQEGWGAVPSAEAQEKGRKRWKIQCPETEHLDFWSLKQGSQPRKTRKTTVPVRLHSSRLGAAKLRPGGTQGQLGKKGAILKASSP